MKRASALVFVSTLLAPAVALACPAAACASCSGGSLLTYLGLFGGGLFAGIGSIALRRKSFGSIALRRKSFGSSALRRKS